ncbi:hypothetical protein FS749_006476 [Ceratobasidium sp. UAMH 11750]|nr:hypothetical protein FS749_006476 [Ceratobasidium sp. UAMH 11750]
MIGPSIGGFLVHPSDHFAIFQSDYWKNNPYALPCFAGAFLCLLTTLVIVFGLDETLPSKTEWSRKHQRQASASAAMRASMYSTHSAVGIEGPFNPADIFPSTRRHAREATDDSEYGPASQTLLPTEKTVSVWSVITPTTIPVLITSFALSFLAAALFAIFPLWAFTPIDKGGLGAAESSIGMQLSIRGLLHVLTLFVYPPVEKRLGLYKLYAWSMVMWVLSGLGFPLLNVWARINGSTDGFIFQVLMWTWLTIWSLAGFSWAGNPQMVNRVAPSEAALARIVGVSTICILLGGTIGPVFATSLFQWSMSLEFAGGNLVWIVMFIAGK